MNSLVARIFIPSFLRFTDVLLFFDEFSLQVTIILCESQEILFCKIFSNVLKPESLDSKTLRAHAMVYFCLSDILRMEGFPRLPCSCVDSRNFSLFNSQPISFIKSCAFALFKYRRLADLFKAKIH